VANWGEDYSHQGQKELSIPERRGRVNSSRPREKGRVSRKQKHGKEKKGGDKTNLAARRRQYRTRSAGRRRVLQTICAGFLGNLLPPIGGGWGSTCRMEVPETTGGEVPFSGIERKKGKQTIREKDSHNLLHHGTSR